MAKKKTIKDVEAEETVKNNTEEQDETKVVEETLVEEVLEDTENFEDDEEFEKEEDEKEEKSNKKEKKAKKVKKQTKKDGYFAQVGKELKKVVWPKGGDIVKYSFAVIVFCVVLCLFFVGIDLIASLVKGLFV